MQSIAFFNNKGGVGKTTLLCNIAAFLGLEKEKRILVVDADPQCNATQTMLTESEIADVYDNPSNITIYSIIHPLSIGKGYAEDLHISERDAFGVDLLLGDPRLALKEDLLARDWQSSVGGDIRGLRTSLLFKELLTKCQAYDYVLFDVGPSLGSINRAVLLACDFFLSPMAIDIFSLKAVENIRTSILEWRKQLKTGLDNADSTEDVPAGSAFNVKFLGYVAQQYTAKAKQGEKRAVAAYEKIMRRIPRVIQDNFVEALQPRSPEVDYRLGTIPNLHSLVPMAQSARKPVFTLRARDGVRGAHFTKVKDAAELFEEISERLEENTRALVHKR